MNKILLTLAISLFIFCGFGNIIALSFDNAYLVNVIDNSQSNRSVLIADFIVSRVIEVDINGSIVWEYTDAITPIDVERLDNGNTLISESYGYERVIEVDRDGNIIWEYNGEVSPFHPADSERLENGNTLITLGRLNQRGIIEVDINGYIVWEYNCTGLFYTGDLERLENGNTLIIIHYSEYNAKIIEVDNDGSKVWEYKSANVPTDVERLENGNTLISYANNQVIEIDIDSNIIWEYSGAINPIDIERLENGNTIIIDGEDNRVIEVDHDGNIIWEYIMLDQPIDVEIINEQSYNNPPVVEIHKPKLAVYINDREIMPFFIPLIFGNIQICPYAYDEESEITQLDIFIDNILMESFPIVPDNWTWDIFSLGKHKIKLTAYDEKGKSASIELNVWKFF
jgi:hypothetical protein